MFHTDAAKPTFIGIDRDRELTAGEAAACLPPGILLREAQFDLGEALFAYLSGKMGRSRALDALELHEVFFFDFFQRRVTKGLM